MEATRRRSRWFTGTLATTLQRLKPYDPESKGVSWSGATGSLKPPSCPGVTSRPRLDFNTQFGHWLDIANARVVRTIKARPVDLLDADRVAMLPFRRSPRRSGGSTGSGWDGTSYVRRQQRLLPSTRTSSAGSSTSTPTCPASRSATTAGSSLPMTGSGHEDRRSPIPSTWPLPRNFANSSSGPVPCQPCTTNWSGTLADMTARSASPTTRRRWPDGKPRNQDRGQ